MALTDYDEVATASIAERAQNGEVEESPEELFPLGSLEGDPQRTLKNLIAPGMRVEVTASLRAAEVPVRNGALFDPESNGEILVTFAPEKLEAVIKRDRDGQIEAWKLRQVLRPNYVQDGTQMYTRAQVVDLLAASGVPDERVAELLA